MQGRQGSGGSSWDRPSERHNGSLNGTGKQRAIPQRPPGMARVDINTMQMPRIARPQPQTPAPRKLRRLLLIIGSIFVVCAILACTAGYLLSKGLSVSSGATATTTDFLGALSTSNYNQAYQDLGPAITLHLSLQQFTQQAQNLDRCYGPITNYPEVQDSATNQGNSQSYTYNISRSKLTKPYQLRLTLQQDPDANNNWKIVDYGNDLGPGQAATTCK